MEETEKRHRVIWLLLSQAQIAHIVSTVYFLLKILARNVLATDIEIGTQFWFQIPKLTFSCVEK